MGGHMKSHSAKQLLPPKLIPTRQQNPSSSSSPSNYPSSDQNPMQMQSSRSTNQELPLISKPNLANGGVSETELSPRNDPIRKRSKRQRISAEKATDSVVKSARSPNYVIYISSSNYV
ncbi:hypothetical protein JCGZ_26927 [Jatropha curcas]|uniref:Uncharacterized protein n=1 Tax=Jatropha curcas TaxID=180498 RepID=A0A067LCT4_JATCU|nr:hypothetical protein JCGZ_26927 [Jatropha curcas]